MSAAVLCLPDAERLAERLRQRLDAAPASLAIHRFPDGERCVRITGDVAGRAVVLVAALDRPEEKLLPLLFAAATARDLGAATVGLVAPYLPYLRQDRRFHPGEGVSARYFARLLSRAVDWVVTVDPHLHRIGDLGEIFTVPVTVVHAAPLLADWIRARVPRPLLLGPDAESAQWVEAIASLAGAPSALLAKRRLGDAAVEVTLPDLGAYAGRHPVLVDDIVSSGRTMIEAIRLLRESGWPAPVCLAVHPVFAPGAYGAIRAAGAEPIVTCNTLSHPTNGIDVDELVAAAVLGRLDLPARGASVVQDALGWIVQVVELAAASRVEEEPREDAAQHQGDREQEEDRVHAAALRTDASTREAPQITTPLESGISTAATSGPTSPAAAAPTASTL